MADKEYGAAIVFQQFFQQLQRIDIEIVGRLIQHQHIRRLREQASEKQAVAFAAGQRLDRRAGALRRKQKIAEISHHMLALAVNLHPVAARRNGVREAGLFIQLRAHLIEIRDLQARALLHLANIRLFLAQDQLQHRGLARAVRPDQPDLVAAQDSRAEVADDGLVTIVLADVEQFGDDLAGAFARRHIKLHLSLLLAPRATLATQFLQSPDATFIAGAARLDTLAYPHFLLREELVELRIFDCFDFQLLPLARLVSAEIAWEGKQASAIQLDDACGYVIEEGTVMGNEQNAALEIAQQPLQPQDGREIEMVGRLVQQQHIRCANQCTR